MIITLHLCREHRCRKVSEAGSQQLLLDTQAIKALLLDFPAAGAAPFFPGARLMLVMMVTWTQTLTFISPGGWINISIRSYFMKYGRAGGPCSTPCAVLQ